MPFGLSPVLSETPLSSPIPNTLIDQEVTSIQFSQRGKKRASASDLLRRGQHERSEAVRQK
jgi:hypothetical protein